MNFSISYPKLGTIQLAIVGELDAATTKSLQPTLDELAEFQPPLVEIDLGWLRLIDCVGAEALFGLYKRLGAQGNVVRVFGLRDQPEAIFRLLRFDRLMVKNGARLS